MPPAFTATPSPTRPGRVSSLVQPDETALRTPVASYLRLFGLGQYAGFFVDAGLGGLGSVARMSEADEVEFVGQMQLYPGHRARLLRAIGLLRQAAALGGREQAIPQGGPPGGDLLLEQLCARLDTLARERDDLERQGMLVQEENHRLVAELERSAARISELERLAGCEELEQARARVAELEALVWTQTEQVSFLAGQLQRLVGTSAPPWAAAAAPPAKAGPESPVPPPAETRQQPSRMSDSLVAPGASPEASTNPAAALLELDLGSGRIRRCLAADGDGAHVVSSLAAAIENKFVLAAAAPPPDVSEDSCEPLPLGAAIFQEPRTQGNLEWGCLLPDGLGRRSLGTLVMGSARECARLAPTPNRATIEGFLLDLLRMFRFEAPVAVIALVYLDRFTERSGLRLSSDIWRRVTFAAVILASKVWDEDAFNNAEIAELSEQYGLDDINAFERVFLQCVGHDIVVTEGAFAKTRFLLETLRGSKDIGEALPQLASDRAQRLLDNSLKKQAELCGGKARLEVGQPTERPLPMAVAAGATLPPASGRLPWAGG